MKTFGKLAAIAHGEDFSCDTPPPPYIVLLMEPGDGDFELLRRYAGQDDQAAFSRLVGRHVDLVFSAAMRRTRDRHLAEDVTQAVFIVLARKAARVPAAEGQLCGWLLRCVRYAAANAIKMEARRQKHEEAAARKSAAMDAGACSSNPTEVLIWHEIAGQLDDAVLKLPSLDRRAVLLRYRNNTLDFPRSGRFTTGPTMNASLSIPTLSLALLGLMLTCAG